MKYLFIILSSFFITGCMSVKPKSIQTYPMWFSKTIQDSSLYYYSIAEGINKNDAIANALNQIASKISISVESKFESNTVVNNNKYNKYSKMDISNKVEKIHFNNYIIINEQQLNGHYLVSIKVNKKELENRFISDINSDFIDIENKLKMDYKNNILKLKNYVLILNSLPELDKKIYILSSVDKHRSIKNYLIRLNNIKNTILKFRNSITFRMQSSDNKYSKILYNFITQKGYKINSRRGIISLKISINKKEIDSLGYKIIKGVIVLKAIDRKNGSVLAEKRLILGGKSISSFAQADEFMLNSFRNKLKNNKLLSELLGI